MSVHAESLCSIFVAGRSASSQPFITIEALFLSADF